MPCAEQNPSCKIFAMPSVHRCRYGVGAARRYTDPGSPGSGHLVSGPQVRFYVNPLIAGTDFIPLENSSLRSICRRPFKPLSLVFYSRKYFFLRNFCFTTASSGLSAPSGFAPRLNEWQYFSSHLTCTENRVTLCLMYMTRKSNTHRYSRVIADVHSSKGRRPMECTCTQP